MRGNGNHNFGIRWLRDLLCGVLIGAGAILPGVSGGVLAVVDDLVMQRLSYCVCKWLKFCNYVSVWTHKVHTDFI